MDSLMVAPSMTDPERCDVELQRPHGFRAMFWDMSAQSGLPHCICDGRQLMQMERLAEAVVAG